MTNHEHLEVIVARIEERLENMEERLDERLAMIYDEAKKTNGRVNRLEDHVDALREVNSRKKGQWDAMLILAAVIGFLIGAALEYFRG
jgi:uncharacterized protein (UPF0335 family)